MTRRNFLSAAAVAAPLVGSHAARPNIVILFTDDQRYDTIRALGNDEVSTPNMDRLVREGTAFTHAHIMGGTSGAVCVPSRAMLMTGQSLFNVDRSIVHPQGVLESAKKPFTLMPTHFGAAGYKTFGTGKWHNGPKLYAQAFQNGATIFFGGMTDQNKATVFDFDASGDYPKQAAKTTQRFTSETFADSTIGFLDSRKGLSDPFFAYCAFTSPHDPRTAPAKYAAMYSADKVRLPKSFLPEHPFDNGELKVRDELLAGFPRTPDEIRKHTADYYAMVSEVDAQIGRVLDTLDRNGQASNTVVVFAGDNGLAVGRHGLMGKQNVYDHSVRVPLVLRGPGVPRNKRTASYAYLFDLFPTLCGLTGVAPPSTVDGRSLVPILRDPKANVRDSVFYGYRGFQRGVRRGDSKLIVYKAGGAQRMQLFDLKSDPDEMRDLSASQPQRVATMFALLRRWQTETGDPLELAVPPAAGKSLP